MYKSTESERSNCVHIVKDILKTADNFECEKYADKIFSITYSIGGDYSEATLRSVAENLLRQPVKMIINRVKQ